jgi:hypothetical protein
MYFNNYLGNISKDDGVFYLSMFNNRNPIYLFHKIQLKPKTFEVAMLTLMKLHQENFGSFIWRTVQ